MTRDREPQSQSDTVKDKLRSKSLSLGVKEGRHRIIKVEIIEIN